MKRRLLITFLLGCLLPFAVQAQHGTFRFAQITDIHFSPNNPNPTEDLLRSVAQINAIDSIDFVAYGLRTCRSAGHPLDDGRNG